jgi:hypothetical protein
LALSPFLVAGHHAVDQENIRLQLVALTVMHRGLTRPRHCSRQTRSEGAVFDDLDPPRRLVAPRS